MTLLYKPFELLGDGLRSLSLSGSVGNIAAIIIYCLISLVPAVVYVVLKNKKSLAKIDGFLLVLSGVLFFVIYYLINPTHFMANGMGDFTLITLFYSLLVGYLVLRGISVWSKSDTVGLQKGIRVLIFLLMVSLVGAILIECAVNLPEAIQTLKDKNTAVTDPWSMYGTNMPGLSVTIVFLVLRSVVTVIPCIWEIVILTIILDIVKELGENRYSEKVINGFEKLGNTCKQMLVATMGLNMGYAVLQVVFRNRLYEINMDVNVPIASIVLVLAVMLVAKYMKETQKMKEELDMFI